MNKLLLLFGLAVMVLLPLSTVFAQAPSPSGISMGHLHLNVQDVGANKMFWATMGGTPTKLSDTIEGVKFGEVRIFLRKAEPAGAAAGSVIGHFGFHVPNIQQAMAKWQAAGLRTEAGRIPGQGYVYTPDGLIRIEILEEPSLYPHNISPRPFLCVRLRFRRCGGGIGNPGLVWKDVWHETRQAPPIRYRQPAGRGADVFKFQHAHRGNQRTSFRPYRLPDQRSRGLLQAGRSQWGEVRRSLYRTASAGNFAGLHHRSLGNAHRVERKLEPLKPLALFREDCSNQGQRLRLGDFLNSAIPRISASRLVRAVACAKITYNARKGTLNQHGRAWRKKYHAGSTR